VSAPAIDRDCTDLVFADLNASPDTCRACMESLSPLERNRAARFRFDTDRRRFVVARGRLREALAIRLRMDPTSVPIIHEPGGKPVVAGEPGLWFSVSRSGDLAAFAFSSVEIGIDLVSLQAGGFSVALASDICSPGELAALAVLGAESRTHALLTLWARKEALLKATGEGLVRSPDWIDVRSGGGERGVHVLHAGRRWWIREVDAPEGHIVSVAEAIG
jgi:4'-phosphopantetheinyl transferase